MPYPFAPVSGALLALLPAATILCLGRRLDPTVRKLLVHGKDVAPMCPPHPLIEQNERTVATTTGAFLASLPGVAVSGVAFCRLTEAFALWIWWGSLLGLFLALPFVYARVRKVAEADASSPQEP